MNTQLFAISSMLFIVCIVKPVPDWHSVISESKRRAKRKILIRLGFLEALALVVAYMRQGPPHVGQADEEVTSEAARRRCTKKESGFARIVSADDHNRTREAAPAGLAGAMNDAVEFGLGLISLGRPWGHVSRAVPSAGEAENFLRSAVGAGVRVFDTAPSYGESESQVGRFLSSLAPDLLARLTIADKCGEHWDRERGEPYIDHCYDALCRSIDRTLGRLPRVDLLQVHRPTAAVLRSPEVRSALQYARSRGVRAVGASVSDVEAARVAAESDLYTHLQFPFNQASQHLEEAFDLAQRYGKKVLVNRPFQMGKQLYGAGAERSGREALVESYRFILRRPFTGFILTGTCDAEHLREDLDAFREAQRRVHPPA